MSLPTQPVEVEQNGVKIIYTPGQITRGKAKGRATLKGNFDKLTDEDLMKLVGGAKGLRKLAERELHAEANSYFVDATHDDADNETEFDFETWQKLASGVSIPGQTLGDIEDSIAEIKEAVYAMMTATIERKAAGQSGELTQEETVTFKEHSEDLKRLMAAKAVKEEINKKRVEVRMANKAKAEANAPLVAKAA